MAIFEVESWRVKPGKEEAHRRALRGWFRWVRDHRDLFKEWKSVRYFSKKVAGKDSGRHLLMWEYESLADYETYKKRRADYTGPYEEYKKNDPYYMDLFDHSDMGLEFWEDLERDLWIE